MPKRGPKRLPRRERFEQRVDRSRGPDACHLWRLKPITRGGYGHFYDDDGRNRRAHVIAWELAHGVVPRGKVVRHKCDTPLCVNVAHLLLGTQGDNLADMRARGRDNAFGGEWERGEQRYNAKLTEESVRWARRERAAGRSITEMARTLGVSTTALGMAVRRQAWRHVD